MTYNCTDRKTPVMYAFESNVENYSVKLSEYVPQRLRSRLEKSSKLSKGKKPIDERLSQAENRRKDYQRAKLESIQRCDSRSKILDDKMEIHFEYDEESINKSNNEPQKSQTNKTLNKTVLVKNMKETDKEIKELSQHRNISS